MESTIHSMHTRTIVKLLNTEKLCVGDGYLSTIRTRQILHTQVLQEDEVAVHVTNVFDSTCKIQEPFQDYLGKCVNPVIWWRCENVVFEEEDAVNKLQEYNTIHTNVFKSF